MKNIAFALSLAMLAACASTQPPPKADPNGMPAISGPWTMGKPTISIPHLEGLRDAPLLSGDSITLTVFQHPDASMSARIPESGKLVFPLLGEIQVAGLTVAQLEKIVREKLEKDYIINPELMVSVQEFVQRKVYILGATKGQGAYPLSPLERMTILQLISLAGGFGEKAFKEYCHIVRRNVKGEREVIRISLTEVEKAVATGNAEADIQLWPDDLVVIPSGQRIFYLGGAVKSGGVMDMPSDTRITVFQAINRAGGYTKYAATSRVVVLRQIPSGETQKFLVNLNEILSGNMQYDMDVMPGDVIWVDERGIFK